jgi:tRNA nucleotidyltransferase (CCA-adding enzyme)
MGNEVLKACAAEAPGNMLRVLSAGGCLSPWLAEFEGSADIPAGPARWHKSSVLEHTTRIMDATAILARAALPAEEVPLAVWMALCHDLGKASTPREILPRPLGHEERGAEAARALGLRLRLPARCIAAGFYASLLHMKAGIYPTLRPGTRTDLIMQTHAARILEPLFLLAAADSGNTELPELARRDAAILHAVSLPPEWRNRGEESGKRLRALRCEALATARSRNR